MRNTDPGRGPFLVEGRWAVEAVLDQSRYEVTRVVVESGRHLEFAENLQTRGIEVQKRDRTEIREDRGFDFHRGVYAEVQRPTISEATEEDWSTIQTIVVPFCLADPGNLGTVIRAAVGFGVDAIFLPEGQGADLYNRKCIRASATAVFQVPVFIFRNAEQFLEELGVHGFVRIATSLGDESVPLQQVETAERMAIFFGSEDFGLPESVASACEKRVRIPMESNLDSLNVGSSAAVVLYELLQRKRNLDL